jgi:hypothetical protein
VDWGEVGRLDGIEDGVRPLILSLSLNDGYEFGGIQVLRG